MEPKLHIRRPERRYAVQVTEENFDEVLKWCKGTEVGGAAGRTIKVNEPSNKVGYAHIGDWVTRHSGGSWRVFKDEQWKRYYEPVYSRPKKQAS